MKSCSLWRYILRHVRRAAARSVLAVLLAALLAGTVGELGVLRRHYAALVDAVEVDVRFFGGLSHSKAKALEKTGYLRDPVYQANYTDAAVEIYYPVTVIFTNRPDSVYREPITWLEGWDDLSGRTASGKYCLMPAPFMEQQGFQLGDEVRINELECIQHLVESGQIPVPKDHAEMLALRDTKRPKYTVIGRIETEDTQMIVVVPPESFQYYHFFGTVLVLDSADYKLCSYYQAEEFREYVRKELLSLREPPDFRMDTSDADRLYRNYRLIETLFPLTVAAALILGTVLPGLMILQEQKEAAVLRALGWSKKLTVRRLTLEQAALCLAGLVLALLALFAVNGSGFLGVIAVPLAYAAAHFALCVAASAAVSASILRKSPMRLLQVKE